MIHELRLNREPFDSIKAKTKTIEMRLYDDKRKKIQVGDTIIFSLRNDQSQTITTKVKSLTCFDSFKDLYNAYDKVVLGYKQNQDAKPEDMTEFYSQEEQALFGVVAIEIEVL